MLLVISKSGLFPTLYIAIFYAVAIFTWGQARITKFGPEVLNTLVKVDPH